MTKTVIGIRFKKAGKIYYFDPLGEEIKQYDHAVVETVQGLEYGEVALGPRKIETENFPFPVKPIVRKSTPKDDADYQKLLEKEKAARSIFDEKIHQRGMDMHLINVEYTFDKRKAVFYFTAEGRVDFRDLVKDLASALHVRIELRQVGVRDEAKLFHTLGCCGRNTCCSEWLGDFTPVSIKMAKEQNLSLNASKISGVCGRLLCCLTYENEFYKSIAKCMPKIGQTIETPEGVGQVYRLDVLRENVVVKIVNDKDETEIRTFAVSDIGKPCRSKPITPEKNEGTVLKNKDAKTTVENREDAQDAEDLEGKVKTRRKEKRGDRKRQPGKNQRSEDKRPVQSEDNHNHPKKQNHSGMNGKKRENAQEVKKTEEKNREQNHPKRNNYRRGGKKGNKNRQTEG